MDPSSSPSVDAAEFRTVMASVCTPVAVVTSLREGHAHGTTVSAFASLSADPPMVLIALDRGSRLLGEVRATSRCGVNVLSSTQHDLAAWFAGKSENKFAGVPWASVDGVPALSGAAGFLSCAVTEFVDGGDHVVLLAGVRQAVEQPAEPLTYHRRGFGTHHALSLSA